MTLRYVQSIGHVKIIHYLLKKIDYKNDLFIRNYDLYFKIYAERNSKSNDMPETLSSTSNDKLEDVLDNLNKTTKIVDAHVMVQIGSVELVVVKNNRTWNKLFTAVLTVLVVLNTIIIGA